MDDVLETRLKSFRDDLVRCASSATEDDAERILAETITVWNMETHHLPAVVDFVAAGGGLARARVLEWLHLTTRVMLSPHGRLLCRELAPAADVFDAADAKRPKH